MKITKVSIYDSDSCGFCQRGELAPSGVSLIYPYTVLYNIKSERTTINICQDCIKELTFKSKIINFSE